MANKKTIADKLESIQVKLSLLDTTNNFINKKLLEIQQPQTFIKDTNDKELSDKFILYFIQQDINDYINLSNNDKDLIIEIKNIIEDILKEI